MRNVENCSRTVRANCYGKGKEIELEPANGEHAMNANYNFAPLPVRRDRRRFRQAWDGRFEKK
ncbi:MAG: hypothetical protein JWM99_1177 [Verrucomicrobiales bacterium]|nr:hypothetical protein [Verrucomicrobiales bacterium]